MSPATFAVLQARTDPIDTEALCGVLERTIGLRRTDVLASCRKTPGFLAAGLAEGEARNAVMALTRAGIDAFALADSDFVSLPEAVELQEAAILPEGFTVDPSGKARLIEWQQVILLDTARVMEEKRVLRNEIETYTSPKGGSYRRTVQKKRTEYTPRNLLDVVCWRPWTRFRIFKKSFRFGACGLPKQPTGEAAFQALVIAFQTRGPNAVAGPGVDLLFDGRPETRQTSKSLDAFETLLLWQLQLRLRK